MSLPVNVTSLGDIMASDDDHSLVQHTKYHDTDSFIQLIQSTNLNTKLSIFNSNARSLTKHKPDFDLLFDTLSHTKNFSFDVLTFDETWLNDDLASLLMFENYYSIYRHKPGIKEGGGIAIYVKEGIRFKVRNDLSFPENKRALYDCLFIEIMPENALSNHHLKNIILGVIYRSPSHPSLDEFSKSLLEIMEKIMNENKDIVLTGDLNIDLLQCKTNKHITDFIDSLITLNLIPKITLPTRISHSSATLIDHVYSNIDPQNIHAGTLLTDITDHFSNFVFCDTTIKTSPKPKYVTYRVINTDTIYKLNEALGNESWNHVYSTNDVNIAYTNFFTSYTKMIDTYLPLKTVRFSKYKHKISPWITPGLLKSLKTKEKMYLKMLSARNTANFESNKAKYEIYTSIYNKTIKAAKKLYWANRFEYVKSDIKQTWQNINLVLNQTKGKKDFPSNFVYNNKLLTNETEISNGFNDYFVDIGKTLANNIKSFPGDATGLLPHRNLPHSFFFEPVTQCEMINIIKSLKPKTSCGYDQISPKLIQKSASAISLPLTHICNISLQTGIFPSSMKLAKVVPIYKNKDETIFNNYRPISLLPAFSKIIERIAHKRLYQYLNTHKLLSLSQYGFQKHMSTEQAILQFQDQIIQNLASKKWCSGIFLDLSKAFDTLDHSILLDKMYHLGIRGVALKWFNDYLSNRSQFVEFKSSKSVRKNIACGVPQGSILGPLLFLIYVNDIVDNINHGNAILFADDTTILFDDINFDSLIHKMNENLNIVYKWLCLNKLSLNIDKTNFIIFHRPQRKIPFQPEVKIENRQINLVSDTKFLGVYVDEHMSWRKQCNTIGNKCLKVTSVLSKLKHHLPCNILLTIYNSLFLPHLSYAITVWGNCKTKELKRLTLLQKRAIRNISKAGYNSHTQPIFKQTKTLTLDDLFKVNCCKLMFKSKQGILKPYFTNLLGLNSSLHSYNTRQTNNVHQQNIKMVIELQLLNPKISKSWNELPASFHTNNFPTIHSFTRALKSYFISLYTIVCNDRDCYVCNQIE